MLAPPIKTHSYSKFLEKSRFASEKTKLDAEFASLPASSFVFSLAKLDFARKFLVRTRFLPAAPAMTGYSAKHWL